ncbi:MAG: peptidase domain-containing ABC transporter [Marivibrio sp.]|uniref:peptidase domain-containing ABC transporter n=1 Tax=Marivibrio sp. TaxID=2039719 RepID=UPI0032EF8D8F
MPELASTSLFINILSIAVPIFVLQVYDRVVFQAGLTTLQGLVAGVLLAVAFDFLLRQLRGRMVQRIAIRVDADVGRMLFGKLARLPLSVLETRTTAQWHALQRDAELARNVVAGPPLVMLIDLPFVALFVAVIWIIAAPIAWVLSVVVGVFLLLALVSQRLIQRSSEAERHAQADRDAVTTEMFAGRTTMKALGLAPALSDRWEDRQATLVEQSLRRGVLTDGFTNGGMALSLLATVGMTSVGALAIINQEMTMGALIAANMLTNKVIQPMNQLVGMWRQLVGFRQALDRLSELFAAADEPGAGALERPRPKGLMKVESARFAYGGGAPVLDGATLELRPGQVHGLIGPNGSGKTTFLMLLQRLYQPQEGRITLDGADLSQFSRPQLDRWIGYVPQDPFFFTGSIAENIGNGAAQPDDAAVLRAAQMAGADAFVDELPEGYLTRIGEGGRRLSTGQRQRLAIARALYADPPVLLMDEPSSSLDRAAEQQLARTLAALARERTVVVVTHSPGLLGVCDVVTAFQKGRIMLTGPGREVRAQLLGERTAAASPTQQSPASAAAGTAPPAPGAPIPRPPVQRAPLKRPPLRAVVTPAGPVEPSAPGAAEPPEGALSKKPPAKKTSAKKTSAKKASAKKSAAKKAAAKKAGAKKTAAKKTGAKKPPAAGPSPKSYGEAAE